MGCTCDFEKRLAAVEEKLKYTKEPIVWATLGPTKGEEIAERMVRPVYSRDGSEEYTNLYSVHGNGKGRSLRSTLAASPIAEDLRQFIAGAIDKALAEASQ